MIAAEQIIVTLPGAYIVVIVNIHILSNGTM